MEPLYEGGELLKLSFEAKPGISKSQLTVEIPIESENPDYQFVFKNASQEDILAATINGMITVKASMLGDANCDGYINVLDANLIRRYAAKFADASMTEMGLINADVNADGYVNVSDANLIRRYAAKLMDEFPAGA